MNTISPARARWLTVFGLGRMRPASGTWGSMPAVVIAAGLILVVQNSAFPGAGYRAAMALGAVWFSMVCVLWGADAEARWGEDPSEVVADEMAGQFVTLLMIPSAMLGTGDAGWSVLLTLVGAFFLFRAFDILKPWPAGAMQRIPGGWGVLLDDLFAGAMAGLVIWIVQWIQ